MHVRQGVVVITLVAVAGGAGCGGGGGASCEGCGEFREVMGAFCDVLERCPISTYPIAYRSRDECEASLYCASGATGMECRARKGAGQPCAAAEECQPDLFCALTGSGAAMACTAGPAGQPCNYGSSSACPDGFFCATRDVCEPLRTLGEDCNGSFEPCVPELYCDTIDGCSERPGEGQECDYNTPCARGFYCDTSASYPYHCVARVGPGAPCSSSTSSGAQCLEEYRCDYDSTVGDDVCLPLLGIGESCSGNDECQSGVCNQSICLVTGQCVMP
ncbi:MAG: hypothetical protein HY906_14560 [Deltaproteobacteria bacterium]|nr:hypothetical protein [Deltaproteobacteria bacterium]